MTKVRSFAPVLGAAPRILILGSMPGIASLEAQQYYAHSRNAFWPIMQAIFAIDAQQPYERRIAGLVECRVALWDVLASCVRRGSLDSSIDQATVQANDLAGLLSAEPSIAAIFFNGQMAETVFKRHVVSSFDSVQASLPMCRLPSTSPANASWSFERKLAAWRAIRQPTVPA